MRAIADVPFSRGTVAISSGEPNAFTPYHLQVLQEMATVLSETSSRMTDLRAVRRGEQRFRLLAQAASDIFYEWNVESGSLTWFGDTERAIGSTPEQMPQSVDAWLERIHPDDREPMAAAIRLHATASGRLNHEYRVERGDGSWFIGRTRETERIAERQEQPRGAPQRAAFSLQAALYPVTALWRLSGSARAGSACRKGPGRRTEPTARRGPGRTVRMILRQRS